MQTLAEMAVEAGLPKKPFYTIPETAKATGIPYSAILSAAKSGRLRAFMPNGRKRGMVTSAEWFEEWIAGGTA